MDKSPAEMSEKACGKTRACKGQKETHPKRYRTTRVKNFTQYHHGRPTDTIRGTESNDQEFHHDFRKITRSMNRIIEPNLATNNGQGDAGKLVWGYCKGWWPAIIITAEEVGIEAREDKVVVFWIGESLISPLNPKTQIQPFSNNLDVRLFKNLGDEKSMEDIKECPFVATITLLSLHLKIPLTVPYLAWAEKNLTDKKIINDIKFYPYPTDIGKRLDELKRANVKITQRNAKFEKNARNNEKAAKSGDKLSKDIVAKSSKDPLSNPADVLPLEDQKPGTLVWGKLDGYSWWPGMIVHNHDCGKKEPSFGCQWIMWYGDYQLSEVNYMKLMKFNEGIKKMYNFITVSKKEIFIDAVLSACKDYCADLNFDTSTWTLNDTLSRISLLNHQQLSQPKETNNNVTHKYSTLIANKLAGMSDEDDSERGKLLKNRDSLPRTSNWCVICCNILNGELHSHPFFECYICTDCIEVFKATIFAYGEDGKCFYCTLCGSAGTVLVCDSCDCPRVYCTPCLKYLICPEGYKQIPHANPWLCFLCDDKSDSNKNRLIEPRIDWKTRISKLFRPNQSDTSPSDVRTYDGQRRRIRVLSLFDGMSTGLVVLEKLGIEVEDYYASEIDEDAETVSLVRFGSKIHRLGDVRNITKDDIKAIAPIDLLIGGSPCNDLSIANPNRLGLHDPNGTGVLFFDYCRIKELVTKANKDRHLLWFFENVASMPSKDRLTINEYLHCEPRLIDASDFSPQHRPRLFWNNLPMGDQFPPLDLCQDLQSVLTPNCNRHALVKKIQTVTTKVNSLKQGDVELCLS
ncbi:DNA (cytosine-5)-methyltransferase 3A-like [Athalia rosae]|uniref:DNA (cytosine-5)-methyltransferase 3A-like n=1 Tax=Athalia rosae TaxID=37344 RepID=UPI002033B080|nr:DNA (cytosine-5)-methyltransferase 3A-like [Athalia rosae]